MAKQQDPSNRGLLFAQKHGSSVITYPHRRPVIPDVLASAQYLFPDPGWSHRDDGSQPLFVGRQKQPGDDPLEGAARLDGAQGFDGADEGTVLADDAFGGVRSVHLVDVLS